MRRWARVLLTLVLLVWTRTTKEVSNSPSQAKVIHKQGEWKHYRFLTVTYMEPNALSQNYSLRLASVLKHNKSKRNRIISQTPKQTQWCTEAQVRTMAKTKHLQQRHSLILERYLHRFVLTMFLYQKSLKIQTTDKVIRVHTEKALSC